MAGKARETWAPPERERWTEGEINRGVNRGTEGLSRTSFPWLESRRTHASWHRDKTAGHAVCQKPSPASLVLLDFHSSAVYPLCAQAEYLLITIPTAPVFLYNTSDFSRKVCVIICLNGSGANAWKPQGVSGCWGKDATSCSHLSYQGTFPTNFF